MTKPTDNDEQDHDAQLDSHAVLRRIATRLGIPLERILDVKRDDARHVISVFGVNSAAGVPQVHVGTAVLAPDEATALGRDIRWVVAQQRSHGPWSLLRSLLWARLVDLIVDARYGLCGSAYHRLRRRGGAR